MFQWTILLIITRSAVFKDYAASARALMTAARFQREEDGLEDIEEVPDDA